MNSAASGLVEAIKIAHPGSDWDLIPIGTGSIDSPSWFVYGGGGMGGTGSMCGVPNGCGIFLNMCGKAGYGAAVMNYYSYTLFPTDGVNTAYARNLGEWVGQVPIPFDELLAQTNSLSPLCHISISKWCDAAGITLAATDDLSRSYKKDRCCKIACDMAAFTMQLLQTEGAYTPVHDPDVEFCTTCHNTGAGSVIPAQQGNMYCDHCHVAPPDVGVGHGE